MAHQDMVACCPAVSPSPLHGMAKTAYGQP
jgi:hypothetical protein